MQKQHWHFMNCLDISVDIIRKKVIILLDEYDTPMQEAYVYGYWEELVEFTRSMFNSAFKTNPYLNRAIMTGITRVSKESIFSDLNNLEVLKKFMVHWNDLYHSADEKFIEKNGRKFFLLYLKPIINGTGNYYIESRTRDNGRTDIIVDYRGRQYIIEIKIWRGDEYHKRGEAQLADYLETYHAKKGYLLSFNFNKNKKTGAKEVVCGDKVILEVVV